MAFQIPALVEKFLNEVTRKHASNASIRPKSQSPLMKVIAFLVKPFNPDFMGSYITTVGTTIWVPDDYFDTNSDLDALEAMSHETQHIIDLKKWGWFCFMTSYLFPQILAVFALLAFLAIPFSLWWLCALGFLGFLAPIPAYFRYRLELNGYRTSYLFGKFVHKLDTVGIQDLDMWVIDQLTNKWYYYAWPDVKGIKKVLADWVWLKETRYAELVTWLVDNGLADKVQMSRLALHLAHRQFMKTTNNQRKN